MGKLCTDVMIAYRYMYTKSTGDDTDDKMMACFMTYVHHFVY